MADFPRARDTIPNYGHKFKMLIQSYWLLSLLFVSSATAAPDKKKTSTIIPLPSSTSVTQVSITPTSSTSTSPPTSTASPAPISSSFYLVVADTGTPFDGDYLYLGQAFPGDGLFVLLFGSQTPNPDLSQTFRLSNGSYGSLVDNDSGLIADYYDLYGGILFGAYGEKAVTCELADGVILCQNTAYSGFYAYPSEVVGGQSTVPYVELGPVPVPEGSVQITLLPVPIN
ncbi:hypothetical protein BDR22DRAFT_872218 [Usnea florida]